MKKVLILSYYWPPSGGSGVQRWMYFAKYLSDFGYEPYVITVDPKYASYKFIDASFENKTADVKVFRTASKEPFNFYSKLIGKSKEDAIPQAFAGESNPGLFKKFARFIRGNFFIPDARIGWVPYALQKAGQIIVDEKIDIVVTTGPPHSTHLVGLKLKEKYKIKWVADFRDPWTEVFYNKLFFRTQWADRKDQKLESEVINSADSILTIGPSMAEILKEKVVAPSGKTKVNFVYNGYDAEVFKNLKAKKAHDKFVICHLGVLSDNQPIDSFVEAMKKLLEKSLMKASQIKILLIGRIAPNILNLIRSELPQIELVEESYMTHAQAMQEIVDSDLLFNSLADVPGGKYLISGKLMEYIATGNPILCLGEPTGDGQSLLSQFENSKVFDRSDKDGIYNFILRIHQLWQSGDKGKGIDADGLYSRCRMTKKLAEILSNIQ